MKLEHVSECSSYYSHQVGDAYFYGRLTQFNTFLSIIFRHEDASDEDTAKALQEVVADAQAVGAERLSIRLEDKAVYLAQTLFGDHVMVRTEENERVHVPHTANLELEFVPVQVD